VQRCEAKGIAQSTWTSVRLALRLRSCLRIDWLLEGADDDVCRSIPWSFHTFAEAKFHILAKAAAMVHARAARGGRDPAGRILGPATIRRLIIVHRKRSGGPGEEGSIRAILSRHCEVEE